MNYQNALQALHYKKETRFAVTGSEPFLKYDLLNECFREYQDYNRYKFYPENQNELVALLKSPVPSVIGMLGASEFKLPMITKSLENFNGCIVAIFPEKVSKTVQITELLSKMTIVECPKLREYGDDYLMWIVSRVMSAGYTLKEEAEKLLYSRIGPDMSSLNDELKKLFLIKKDKEISLKDIEDNVPVTAVKSAFDILDNLLRRNIESALTSFHSYMRFQDSPAELVKFMATYIEKAYRLLCLKKIDSDVSERIGIPEFLIKTKYLPRAKALGKDFLASKYSALCDMDISMRLFKGNKNILFERFILNFS